MNLPISQPPKSGKHPARSKTVWFNLLALILGALMLFLELVEKHSGLLQDVLPPKWYLVVVIVVPVVNLILRPLTRQALTWGKSP